MKCYLVGGAVRDRLLGLAVKERDWVVTGATGQEMLSAGFRQADAAFPVFLHPDTGEEYALARTERKTGRGYKGFEVDAGPDVTLEQDLARRDLTINALAQDEEGRLTDCFQGRDDLEARRLRHITPAFIEDPLRLLRIARFASSLGGLGFEVAPETKPLLSRMAGAGELQTLKPERIWREVRRALMGERPRSFFEVLRGCGALALLMPSVDRGGERSLVALENAATATEDLSVRFTALFHPTPESADNAETLCRTLRAERECCDLLKSVARWGTVFSQWESAGAEAQLALLEGVRAFRDRERFRHFLLACGALWPESAQKRTGVIQNALAAAKTIKTESLLAEGFSGPELGAELARRRIDAIREESDRES